jgi:predicted MFS family arabinose efflux permease
MGEAHLEHTFIGTDIPSSQYRWSSLPVVGTLLAGAILVLAFLMRERTAAAPMIDLDLFAKRNFTISNIVGFLMSFGLFGAVFFITQFIQDVLRVSPLTAGQETMPWTASIMLVAPLAGLLTRRMGIRLIILIGMLAQAVALAYIGLLATTTIPYIALLPAFILTGLGMGFTFGPVSSVVMNAVSTMQQGQASSISNTVRELGGVFGIALLGIVFGQITSNAEMFVNMFRATVLVGASIVAVGGLLTLLLPRTVPVSSTGEVLQEVEKLPAA